MAADGRETSEDDSGEFAEFMADISNEIAQRVQSLEPAPAVKAQPEARKPTPAARDAGLILEWENVVDRMIEEMR
jgi:hypothetical protein